MAPKIKSLGVLGIRDHRASASSRRLRAAATEPLTREARFDQTTFRARLNRYTSHRLTGAFA